MFNLKDAATSRTAYEKWAAAHDVPTVKNLKSVDDFQVFRMGNILGTETPSPYQYCEIIEVNDLTGLFSDIGTPEMQKIAGEFAAFADNPLFVLSEKFA